MPPIRISLRNQRRAAMQLGIDIPELSVEPEAPQPQVQPAPVAPAAAPEVLLQEVLDPTADERANALAVVLVEDGQAPVEQAEGAAEALGDQVMVIKCEPGHRGNAARYLVQYRTRVGLRAFWRRRPEIEEAVWLAFRKKNQARHNAASYRRRMARRGEVRLREEVASLEQPVPADRLQE